MNLNGQRKLPVPVLWSGCFLVGALLILLLPRAWLFTDGTGEVGPDSGEASWACPMLCVVVDHPGNCPVCGMELEPFHSTGDEVVLGLRDQEMIGLTLAEVTHRDLRTSFTAPGTVEYDLTGLHSITARAAGRIETLYVDHVGQSISTGAAVARIYSPELYTAQRELLILLEGGTTLADGAASLAVEKLRLLGLSEGQISALASSGGADPVTTIPSPASGTVTSLLVTEGSYVSAGQSIAELADVSTVWVTALLTEDQAGLVSRGDSAELVLDALPGQVFPSVVDSVDPFLDGPGGASRARVVLDNGASEFLPGQSVTVSFSYGSTPGNVPAVPAASVMRLGERSVVYILTGPIGYEGDQGAAMRVEEARFRPVEVVVGRLAEDSLGNRWYPVLDGLPEGTVVALDGAFLIDSQAELLGLPSLLGSPGSR